VQANPNAINTGFSELDQTVTVLLSTSMFVGGVISIVLDNTVPGTREERGLIKWELQALDKPEERSPTPSDATDSTATIQPESAEAGDTPPGTQHDVLYDLPSYLWFLERVPGARWIPFCPSFDGCCRRRKTTSETSIKMSDVP